MYQIIIKTNTMEKQLSKFVILDTLGGLHATIKAGSSTDALKIYKGGSTMFNGSVFALNTGDIENFKNNIKKLK